MVTRWWNRVTQAAGLPAVMIILGVLLLSGCAATREPGKPLRTSIEQLLLSQALERTLKDVSVPLPGNAAVLVDAVGLTRDNPQDQDYVRQALALHLAGQGFRLAQREDDAAYRVSILIQTLGTEQGVVFLGLPPVQSVLLPFALPEIALYKDLHATGHVRWAFTVLDRSTGRMISASPWYDASTYYNHYTVFFLITFRLTNLEVPE